METEFGTWPPIEFHQNRLRSSQIKFSPPEAEKISMKRLVLIFLLPLLSACGAGFEAAPNLFNDTQGSQEEEEIPSPNPPPAEDEVPIPEPTPEEPAPPTERPKGGTAVDLSRPVNVTFLADMKARGVSTIIRYYDHPNETLRGKTLRKSESDLIRREGFRIAVVFQHNNNRLTSFTPQRGEADAQRSLALAVENGQPQGSAIYFGVDGGWATEADLGKIAGYVARASRIVRGAGFKMGVYGSGRVCRLVLTQRWADFCWLANATGWPDYAQFFASGDWVMKQSLPTRVGAFEVDFNEINPEISEFGQFR